MENPSKTVQTRYSDAELAEFKALIEKKLARAKREMEFYKEELASSDTNSKVKGLDDGTGTAENNRIAIIAARQVKYIKHLENALVRIENKVYGICRETGKLISKDRLRAVPHTTLSIAAKTGRK